MLRDNRKKLKLTKTEQDYIKNKVEQQEVILHSRALELHIKTKCGIENARIAVRIADRYKAITGADIKPKELLDNIKSMQFTENLMGSKKEQEHYKVNEVYYKLANNKPCNNQTNKNIQQAIEKHIESTQNYLKLEN
ncbi:hypothetical protein [Rickettsiales endosymbiont of Stachyamoeba lipophora]|uniref:hypothetical protein n=1 Tax=Rickettsiales endosymbiont of Stachyamoeba lipophora TaxID=2486578 RepID=UPI000F64E17B|nr:hypothetical protein [Rickettsiales endosymbiont of Stachyamoeba lipophora]AZL16097.1 hypothetical protein EF513_06065 [Rickettsiales endosymbiont of Stachyamoeba lipophora]